MARRHVNGSHDVGEPGYVAPALQAAQREFERRGELVTLQVELMAGPLEDLHLLLEHRYGEKTLSEVLQEAVRWFLAREARSLLELRAIEEKRRRAAQLEADAIALSREERETRDLDSELDRALAIARARNPTGGDG